MQKEHNYTDILCRVCGSESKFIFTTIILKKYKVGYYKCNNCEFVQTEFPYWLEEAYNSSINLSDTGLIRRNIMAVRSVSTVLFFLFRRQSKYLDYAGGYGLFTRMMRDIGFDFYTMDLYTPNLLARGFDYNSDDKDKIDMLTTFESFEHLVEPIQEIEKMLRISKNIFFSTQLIPNPIPDVSKWWYYSPQHGQHISFYSSKTLLFIAAKYNLNVYSLRGYHLFTERRINSFLFKILVGLGRFGLHKIPMIFMKSRTFSDSNNLQK